MNENQALEILIKTALVAQAKGALSLDDAVVVKQAIDVFVKNNEQVQNLELVEEDGKSEE
jgi:hypothetical protein